MQILAKIVTIAGAVLIVCFIGCAVLRMESVVPGRPINFNHALHGDDEELSCEDCHRTFAAKESAGMPRIRQCQLCHDPDEEFESKPPERRLSAFLMDDEVRWSSVTQLPDEVIFSHKTHHDAGVECASCHEGIETAERVTESLKTSKASCLECHGREGLSGECSLCHSVIDRNWAPPNHLRNWTMAHGQVSRMPSGHDPAEDCSLCHEESACVTCHLDEEPRNHTNYWRQRGHSIDARIDRDRCATCHQSDSCDRCHDEVAPRNHVGQWGSALNFHCITCHEPLQGESCFVCHKDRPSHLLAAPKPADFHSPGLNCRQCHGVSAPLPHVDNGDDCNFCHQ